MANPYSIDWSADLTPAIGTLAQAIQNSRANKRSEAYLDMERDAVRQRAERESAAAARQRSEDERRHAIEAFQARPGLERMARKSVSAANMNPYGFTFEEKSEPPSLAGTDLFKAA